MCALYRSLQAGPGAEIMQMWVMWALWVMPSSSLGLFFHIQNGQSDPNLAQADWVQRGTAEGLGPARSGPAPPRVTRV